MNAFSLWLISLFALFTVFFIFPEFRFIIFILTIPYIFIFFWGIFDLRSNFFVKAYINNKNAVKKICITFDDGPDPNLTPQILQLLSKFNFKATFFVIGEKAKIHSDIIRQIFSQGHLIACHDLNHKNTSNFRFVKAMVRDISLCQQIIFNIIGKKMLIYRPPIGLSNPHLSTALLVCGMKCIGWSNSVKDAGNKNLKNIKKISKMLFKDGDVILLHDCLPVIDYKSEILNQIEILFNQIKKEGFEPITVDQMFEINAYES